MSQRIEQHDGYAVVYLKDEVDMNTSPAARELILNALHHRQDLLVDLSGVTYIDSSGVANLVEGYKIAKQQSLYFGLVGVSPFADKVLRLARLDQVFPIHRSIADWTQRAGPSET